MSVIGHPGGCGGDTSVVCSRRGDGHSHPAPVVGGGGGGVLRCTSRSLTTPGGAVWCIQ